MLTDLACRKARPGPKDFKLPDAKGLFLLVRPNGSKLWRLKYRFFGTEKQLSMGSYPEVSLEQARLRQGSARALLESGLDPSTEKKKRHATAAANALNTFEKLGRAWHEGQSAVRDKRYCAQVLSRLERDVFPRIGTIPLDQITAPMVLELLRRIEARGAAEMARKVRMHVSHIFDWAISAGIAQLNPAARVARALVPKHSGRRAAVVTISEASRVLAVTEALRDTYWATRLASRLLALTAARPGNVRLAEREEFEGLDGAEPVWRIPAAKLKLKRERKSDSTYDFRLPLSRQAVATIQAAMRASPSPRWLFPGIGDHRKPISDSTLSGHYRDAGFAGHHVPHGWRSSFSTIMNERSAIAGRDGDRAIIDMMLAHMPEGVEAAYNRSAYMARRRELAQTWGDLLMAGLVAPEELLPR